MLINSVSLFNNRFKNYQNTNVNKEYISFDASPKEGDKVANAVKETVLDRIAKGQISESGKKFLKGLEEARKNGDLEPDGIEERRPGMPESD